MKITFGTDDKQNEELIERLLGAIYKINDCLDDLVEAQKPPVSLTPYHHNPSIVGNSPPDYLNILLGNLFRKSKPTEEGVRAKLYKHYKLLTLNGGVVITRKGNLLAVSGKPAEVKLDVYFYDDYFAAEIARDRFLTMELESVYAEELLNWKLLNR